jgi:DNA-binding SARP family transcriptional activator/nucleoid-associated protein YgaU
MSPRQAVDPAPGRAAGRLRRLAGALVALVALAALLVGIPLVLLQFGSWPITGVPTGEQIRDLPSTIVTDDAVIALLTVLLWAAWALFAASVLVEVVAQIRARARGEARPARSIAGPVQSAARYLVGTVLMSVGPVTGIGGALPVGAAVHLAPPAAHADYDAFWSPAGAPDSGIGHVLDVEDPSREPAAPAAPTEVTVGRGDTAWSLAADHLGDGARWREIWDANRTRVQPDGAQWADEDQAVQAGWTLVIPGATRTGATPAVQTLAAAPEIAAEVTVQPGDNFWDLAEGQLTDAWGRAPSDAEVVGHWQALVETNRDGLAPPGDPDLIHPGQVFSVPDPPPDPDVVQGLVSGVALGEPVVEAAPEATPDCDPPAPTAPATPVPSPPAPSTTSTTSTAEPAPSTTSTTEPAPSTTSTSEPAPTTSTTADDERDAGAVPPAGDATDPGDGTPGAGGDDPGRSPGGTETVSGAADDAGLLVPVGLVGGGVALAGALALLERRRRAQQRHRRPGRAIPLPEGAGRTAEQQLRWGADLAGAQLLDVALRAAAASAGATGLPRLAWAEAQADSALLVLAHPSPAPPGFVALDGSRWVTGAPIAELAHTAAHAAAPAPTLVAVGTTDQGTELLVELETGGVVTVDGPRSAVAGLLRAIVVALSTAPWSDQPRIVTVGLEPELDRLPGVGSAPTLGDALLLAEQHAEAAEAALRSLRCPSVAQARAVGATPEAWDPLVIVSAVPPGERSERRRLEDLARRPNAAVGTVVVPSVDTGLPGRRFAIGDHGWLAIDGVHEPVRPRHLAARDAGALVELLLAAHDRRDVAVDPTVVEMSPRRPPPPPPPPPEPPVLHDEPADPTPAPPAPAEVTDGGDVRPAPPPPPSEPTPARVRRDRLAELLGDVEVLVRVLGEVTAVRVTGPEGQGETLVPTRQRALEAVAYLALREAAVDREDLEISLFPHGANAAKTVYNTVSSARALLGDELFPPPDGGRYELSAAVVTDYGVFSELVAEADETEDALEAADLLHQALTLVRGEPFMGVGRSYSWVGPHRGMIVAQVVDAAEELAEVRLAAGDWRSAEWAARQGLRAFPSDERMYRLLMRTARAAGNVPGVQRVFRELCDVLADPEFGVEPEDTVHPETIELLEELTGARPRQGRLGA